jgi:serine/threonine protein kinase
VQPIECLNSPVNFTNNASSSAAQRSFEGERAERRDLVLSKNYYVGQPIVVSVGGPQLHKVVLSNGTTISLREEYGVAASTKNEMERLTRLPSHPNVLDHYCVTYTPETGATCFFQELFSTGQTLKSTVEELDRPLSEFTAKAFVKQLLSGLSFIHSHRIAHRNLQLRNILVSNSGRIKISEFSSAKGVEQGCDQSLTVVASPECTPQSLSQASMS